MYKVGWFSTGRGEGSKGLLRAVQDSISSGELDAELAFVFCSRERGETEATDAFLDMVEGYGIPLVSYSYRRYRRARGERTPGPSEPMPAWRLDYDREVMARLSGFQPDICVLAGYLLILTEEMCRRYDIINLHPAAPGGPAGLWQNVIWQLIEEGAEKSGVMMHLAIPELDKGPVVTYCTFAIRGGELGPLWEEVKGHPLSDIRASQGEDNALFSAIRKRGVIRETPIVIATIRAFSEGRVSIGPGRRIVDAAGNVIGGYDLTDEIDERIRRTSA